MSDFDGLMYKECNFTVHLYTRKQVVVAIHLQTREGKTIKKKTKKNTRVVTVSISSIISYSNRVVLFFSRNAVKFVDFDAQHEVTLTVSLV
jgi:hypothetical protein